MSIPVWKTFLPHAIALAFILAVISFFYWPVWQGKDIIKGDLLAWEGAAAEALNYHKSTGNVALWTNSMFGGMPTYQIAVPPKGNFFDYVQQALSFGILKGPILTFFICGLSFYILYILLGLSSLLAVCGALATVLVTSNFLLFEAGHLTKLLVLASSGFIIAGFIVAYKSGLWRGCALFALGAGLNVINNHVQMSYYLFLSLLPLAVIYLIESLRERNWKGFVVPSAWLAAIAVLAVLSSASVLLPTYEYAKQTMRGEPILTKSPESQAISSSEVEGLEWNYAMSWSNGWLDIASGLVPGAAGGSGSEPLSKQSAIAKDLRSKGYQIPKNFQAPLYWGELPFTGGPFYFGAVLCFLFVLGAFVVRGPLKWWLISATAIGILLSMGKHMSIINRPLFDYFPLFNKFRAPSSMLSVISYLIPILAFLAVLTVVRQEWTFQEFKRKWWISLGLTGGVCLFFAVLGPSFFSFSSPADATYAQSGFSVDALESDRMALMRSDGFRSLAFVLLTAAAVYFLAKGNLSTTYFGIALLLLILIDLGGVARRYVHWDQFVKTAQTKKDHKPRPVDLDVLADKSYYRVLDLTVNTFNSSIPSFHHKHVGGYHAAKLQRFQDLIDKRIQTEINQLSDILQVASSDSILQGVLSRLMVLNMLNTKYFILGQPGKEVSLTNVHAYGPAWFVKNVHLVESANDEISSLNTQNLRNTAVVHSEFKNVLSNTQFDAEGMISLKEYTPNKITYSTRAGTNQLAVFSEIWYGPNLGWKIYIDGKEGHLIRANYGLRAAEIPAGQHEVVLEFSPSSYYRGIILGRISSAVLLLLIGVVLYREIKSVKR